MDFVQNVEEDEFASVSSAFALKQNRKNPAPGIELTRKRTTGLEAPPATTSVQQNEYGEIAAAKIWQRPAALAPAAPRGRPRP